MTVTHTPHATRPGPVHCRVQIRTTSLVFNFIHNFCLVRDKDNFVPTLASPQPHKASRDIFGKAGGKGNIPKTWKMMLPRTAQLGSGTTILRPNPKFLIL